MAKDTVITPQDPDGKSSRNKGSYLLAPTSKKNTPISNTDLQPSRSGNDIPRKLLSVNLKL